MGNEIVLGVGIVVFLLFIYSNSLEKEHYLLKLMISFFSLTFLITVPASLVATYASVPGVMAFWYGFLGFYGLFWTYTITYLFFFILNNFGSFKGGRKR